MMGNLSIINIKVNCAFGVYIKLRNIKSKLHKKSAIIAFTKMKSFVKTLLSEIDLHNIGVKARNKNHWKVVLK